MMKESKNTHKKLVPSAIDKRSVGNKGVINKE